MKELSPKRQRVVRIIKKHIDKAVTEIGADCCIELEGEFNESAIKLILTVINN